MQLKATINTGVLLGALKTVSCLVDECIVNMSPEGWNVRAVDHANVAMVSLKLDRSAFESYECDSGAVAVDIHSWIPMLEKFDRNGNCILELVEDGKKLKTTLGGACYTISLLDPVSVDPTSVTNKSKLQALELPCRVILSSDMFTDIVGAASQVGDHIQFRYTKQDNKAVFASKNNVAQFENVLSPIDSITINGTEDARSLFSLDYINDVAKGLKKFDCVEIHFGTNYPCRLRGIMEYCTVEYLIAPRIEDE